LISCPINEVDKFNIGLILDSEKQMGIVWKYDNKNKFKKRGSSMARG
jgi:hypothetical protein